jgi:hypothetical protein
MRRVLAHGGIGVVSAVLVLLCDVPSRAQSCHAPTLREPTGTGFHVGFGQVIATFSEGDDHGDYQGLIPGVAWSHPLATAELALPIYRLANHDDEAIGLGDLAADVRVALLRSDSGGLAFGPELAFSLPTGDADRELGMGHVMAMPGVWLRASLNPIWIWAQLSYGRAIGSDASSHAQHHHDGATGPAGASPRVNPMNMEELGHSLAVRYAVSPNLSLTARWVGGVPLTSDGIERQLIGPGLQIEAEPLDASLDVQVPVAGDPFDVRVGITFGAQL